MNSQLKLIACTAALAIGTSSVGAVEVPIYQADYLVEATITPTDASASDAFSVEEVWSTLVYRDARQADTFVRVFGEALHFEFDGEDYFILKRAGSSAGAYDLLAECLGIDTIKAYANAGLPTECTIAQFPPMVVKVSDDGVIERISRDGPNGAYPDFSVVVRVRPTDGKPSYDLVARFPWIADLPEYEPSILPPEIPESGMFVPAKHYRKDFVVTE